MRLLIVTFNRVIIIYLIDFIYNLSIATLIDALQLQRSGKEG
jgi:hypothetical protein